MRLTLSYYLTHHVKVTPTLTEAALDPFVVSGRVLRLSDDVTDSDFHISWGDPSPKVRTATMETGFFNNALHLDTVGLYQFSSLNLLDEHRLRAACEGLPDVRPLVLAQKHPSKFPQVKTKCAWNGVVLPLQNPGDRSIHRGSSSANYYAFVEGACRFYGKKLFLKLHPWNSGEIEKRFRDMAAGYGSTIERCDTSVVENCDFVLLYNSTFVVDCLVRNVAVAQFAPGYFWRFPGVNYTERQYPVSMTSSAQSCADACKFLLWKYCFPSAHSTERMIEIFEHFATSNELFPLQKKDSYAQWLLDQPSA